MSYSYKSAVLQTVGQRLKHSQHVQFAYFLYSYHTIKEADRKKYAVQEAQRNGYVVGNVKGTKRRNTNSANLRNT